MSDIGKGDWVECIHGNPVDKPSPGQKLLSIGAIYQVEEVGHYAPLSADYVVIVGFYSDHPTRGWLASAFRPIYRPKSEIIEALKQPVTRTPRPAKKHREDA